MNKNGQFRLKITRRKATRKRTGTERSRARKRARARARADNRKRIILRPRRIILGKRKRAKKRFDIGLFFRQQLGITPLPKSSRIIGQTIPLGVGGVGAVPQAVGVLGKLGSVAKAGGKFAITKPKTALALTLGIPTLAGFVATPLGKKVFSPFERARTGKALGTDPAGFFQRLFGFGGKEKPVSDLISRQRDAGKKVGGFNIGLGGIPPIVIGAGIGAGLSALAFALRARGQELSPPILSKPTLGAQEPSDAPVGAPALEKSARAINIRVKPTINVKTIVKPKIINIQQSMM